MTTALTWLLFPIGLLLLSAALLLVFQGLASLWPDRGDSLGTAPRAVPRHVVLMPAHDEEDIIAETVRETLQRMGPQGRLLVVADNCADATAERARSAGAEVTERHHASERGKGYALAHGLAQLAGNPPEVVLVLDADCQVEPGAIDILAIEAHARQRPVQGRYDMLAPPGAGLKQRMAAFAWDFRLRIRAEGYRRVGLPAQLMGSGMAFPWSSLQRVSLANGHLVEDLKLGLDFASAGRPPVLCPTAVVSSQFPLNEQGANSQRQRWEHGHLSMVFSAAPRLLLQALRQGNGALLAMVIDMSVPPLAFLVMVSVLYLGLVALLMVPGWVAPWLVLLALLSLGLIAATVVVAWWRVGRRWIGLAELLTAPWYVLKKVPVYVSFLSRRQMKWIRTRRD